MVAKQLTGQEKILAEYPYLWAVRDLWPVKDLQVSNDAARFMTFMDQHYKEGSERLKVWAYVKRGDESIAVWNISPKPEDARRARCAGGPIEVRWGNILGEHLRKEIWTVIVVQYDPAAFAKIVESMVLFRNKDRSKTLNTLIDVWLRVNS